jgi:hypothetical protein
MNPDSRKDKRSKNNRTAKAIDAMHIAGIVVAALLVLPGLTIVGSYNSASAQQNMTGGGGNQPEVMMHLEEVRKALQNNDNQGAMMHLDLAMNLGGNQPEVMMHLEEVRKALQNNDNQGAMMHLDLAMNLLRGGSTQDNMTSTPSSTNSRYP